MSKRLPAKPSSRPPANPFYAVLGLVGFLFAITATSYCVFVLRAIRPESANVVGPHAFEILMNRYGSLLLFAQLAVLAVATIGAVAVDHFAGQSRRHQRTASQVGAAQPDGQPAVATSTKTLEA